MPSKTRRAVSVLLPSRSTDFGAVSGRRDASACRLFFWSSSCRIRLRILLQEFLSQFVGSTPRKILQEKSWQIHTTEIPDISLQTGRTLNRYERVLLLTACNSSWTGHFLPSADSLSAWLLSQTFPVHDSSAHALALFRSSCRQVLRPVI